MEVMRSLARDSIRIVHVEDDNDFAALSARGLRRAGFSQPVVRCRDGLCARDYFSTIEAHAMPDVILLDLHMPGMNGLEVLSWIRESYRERDVTVVLLTSSQDPEHRRQAAASGATAYLLKAPLADILIQKLDSLIALRNRNKRAPTTTDATLELISSGIEF